MHFLHSFLCTGVWDAHYCCFGCPDCLAGAVPGLQLEQAHAQTLRHFGSGEGSKEGSGGLQKAKAEVLTSTDVHFLCILLECGVHKVRHTLYCVHIHESFNYDVIM